MVNIQVFRRKHDGVREKEQYTNGEGGLSPRTVTYLLTVIRSALNKAKLLKYVQDNVAAVEYIENPRQERKEINVLTKDETEKFLKVTKENRLYMAFLLDLTSGLMAGENYWP